MIEAGVERVDRGGAGVGERVDLDRVHGAPPGLELREELALVADHRGEVGLGCFPDEDFGHAPIIGWP